MFTFAHISDLHIAPLPAVMPWTLASKRVLGYLSWHGKRKDQHRLEVLAALRDDLRALAPDHVCVTGDLTNLALPAEFAAAADWLSSLGDPDAVSVVPGNHDAYVRVAPRRGLDLWRPWMTCDDGAAELPYVRRRGSLAIVGVSSAVPTAPFMATGRVGPAQCARLGEALSRLGHEGRYRVVLIHHPPQPGAVRARHQLRDAGAVRHVLASAGAELVLHGHAHRSLEAALAGPEGSSIPVLGAASASSVGAHGRPAAHYHLVRVESRGAAMRATVEHRDFDPAARHFVTGRREQLSRTALVSPRSAAAGAP